MVETVPAWAARTVRELTNCAGIAAAEANRRVEAALKALAPTPDATQASGYGTDAFPNAQAFSEARAKMEAASAVLGIAVALNQRAQDVADDALWPEKAAR